MNVTLNARISNNVIKVQQAGSILQPSSSAVSLRNQVLEIRSIEDLPDVLVVEKANNALISYNTITSKYEVKPVIDYTVRSITANGVSSPGDGYVLSVDAGGNTYWFDLATVSINTTAQYTWSNTQTFNGNVVFNGPVVANTLSLSTALPSGSGGTGVNTYVVGDLLVGAANSQLSVLALDTAGKILQSNGSALVYDTIDCGEF